MTKVELELPRQLPALELRSGAFVMGSEATLAQWREAKGYLDEAEYSVREYRWRKRTIAQMVKIGDALGLPDDVPLWPVVKSRAGQNVMNLPPKKR